MCGIMGYVGSRSAGPILIDGLRRLEYRGYDSAGIAVLETNGDLSIHKQVGKLETLATSVSGRWPSGQEGIGHTRWATHGKPNDINAHPHSDCTCFRLWLRVSPAHTFTGPFMSNPPSLHIYVFPVVVYLFDDRPNVLRGK